MSHVMKVELSDATYATLESRAQAAAKSAAELARVRCPRHTQRGSARNAGYSHLTSTYISSAFSLNTH